MLTIYHNNHCSKSCATLSLLQDFSQEVEVKEYLVQAPSVAELRELLVKLRLKPEELVRKGEPLYKAQFEGRTYSDEEWLQILAEHPVLIERPIVVKGDRAVIARPPERVQELLQEESR